MVLPAASFPTVQRKYASMDLGSPLRGYRQGNICHTKGTAASSTETDQLPSSDADGATYQPSLSLSRSICGTRPEERSVLPSPPQSPQGWEKLKPYSLSTPLTFPPCFPIRGPQSLPFIASSRVSGWGDWCTHLPAEAAALLPSCLAKGSDILTVSHTCSLVSGLRKPKTPYET